MKIHRTYWGIALSALAWAGGNSAAMAQSETPAPSDSGLADDAIVVTAQRRAERAQDVPITITNIGSEQLANANIHDLGSIAKLTPALRFDHNGPFAQPSIRGVGSAVVTSGAGSNVGVYIDGFFSPNPQAADFQLLSVESVQVLKGPQGTLFGRNTTGGAILVTTAKPSEETGAVLSASYGRFNAQRYEGYATTGIANGLAVDVAGTFSKGDNYFREIVTGNDEIGRYENWSIRAGVKADVTDNLSLLMRYEHRKTDDPTAFLQNAYVLGGQVLSQATIIPNTVVASRPGEISTNVPVIVGGNHDTFQFTATLDLGVATLTSYTQWRNEDNQFQQNSLLSNPTVATPKVLISDRTFTQELLLTSRPGPRLQWTVGAFYMDYKDTLQAFLKLPASPTFGKVAGSNSDTRSVAGYADLTYQLTDKLFVTGGVRLSHDEVRDGYYFSQATGQVFAPTLNGGTHATPRVVVRYKPDEASSIYASFNRGYKAAIFNLGGLTTVPVKQETISAFEVGYKRQQRNFSLDLSAYYYDYKGLQLASYRDIGGVPASQVTNAATSRIFGIEGQVRYDLSEALQLSLSGAYTNAKYRSFPNSPGFAPCFSLPVCGTNYGKILPTIVDASGDRMQRAPEFTGSAGARYSTGLLTGQLNLSSFLYYTSKFYFDTSQQLPQKAFATLDLRAEWLDPSQRYSIAVFGDNVTDNRHSIQAYVGSNAGRTVWNAPATWGVELKANFP